MSAPSTLKGVIFLKKIVCVLVFIFLIASTITTFAEPDVAAVIGDTWRATSSQIKTVVNTVVFPVIDLILAVFFFIKLGMAYFDYKKHGQFEWAAPAILFACLVFTLTAPTYLWTILGI